MWEGEAVNRESNGASEGEWMFEREIWVDKRENSRERVEEQMRECERWCIKRERENSWDCEGMKRLEWFGKN